MQLLKVVQFLSSPCPGLLICNLTSLLLEVSIQLFFFLFLFLSYIVFLLVLMLPLLILAAVIIISPFKFSTQAYAGVLSLESE